MTKSAKKRGTLVEKQRLSVNECRLRAPRHVETPQFEDAAGEKHLTESDALEGSMRYLLRCIVDRDVELGGLDMEHSGPDEDAIVDFIVRNREQIRAATCIEGANVHVDHAFGSFMRNRFGPDWDKGKNDDNKALIAGMRDAFIAGLGA
jgi:hypothetical protein